MNHTAKTVLPSYRKSVDVAENSNSLDDTSFLDASTSPINLLDAIFGQGNCQLLLETGLKKKTVIRVIFSIQLMTFQKHRSLSSLLPTQPLPQRRSRTCCNALWIIELTVNADKYAPWLNISPDISPEKLDPVTKQTLSGKNTGTAVSGSCSSQILSDYNCGELRRLTSNTTECPENQISERITVLENFSMVLGSTLPVTSTSQEETSEDQLDISSISDDFSLPLTPPKTLRKVETLEQVSLATVLNRSNVVDCYTVSLMNVISSLTFCRNDGRYVSTSRFDDDGKVRRKPVNDVYYMATIIYRYWKEPSTLEYYWEIRMPNREQRGRGQIIESNSPIALKTEYKPNRRARRRLFN
uniref:Uncharacterized protein n=1 Tax=Wuchereria bancrofti TaxID=6293 RepID=A0AAF5RTM0_WUCBA